MFIFIQTKRKKTHPFFLHGQTLFRNINVECAWIFNSIRIDMMEWQEKVQSKQTFISINIHKNTIPMVIKTMASNSAPATPCRPETRARLMLHVMALYSDHNSVLLNSAYRTECRTENEREREWKKMSY